MKLVALALLMTATAFAQRGAGGRVGGYGRVRSVPPPVAHPVHSTAVVVPYPVYYVGGYYGYDPSVPLASQSAPAYDADPYASSASQSPVVVLNQNFRPDASAPYYDTPPPPDSAIHSYDAAPAPREPEPTIYLIAMTDHSIVAAIGYWVDGDTLDYITQEGNQNRVSMALVDRDFSKQLNDERHVDFKLPKAN